MMQNKKPTSRKKTKQQSTTKDEYNTTMTMEWKKNNNQPINKSTIESYLCCFDVDSRSMCFVVVVVAAVVVVAVDETMCTICVDFVLKTES